MAIQANQSVQPIMSPGTLRRNKAHQYNSMGLSAMYKTSNKSTGHLNKVSSAKLKNKQRYANQDLFKF